jgi:hypothetical protein
MTTRLTTRGTTRLTTRGTSPGGAFDIADLANRFLDFWAADGALTASAVPAANGEAVQTWNDFSGQGNHIAAQNAGLRPAFSAAGGPIGQPIVSFNDDQLRRASFTAGEVSDFVFIGLIRIKAAGFTAGETLFAGDGSPICAWQNNSQSGGNAVAVLYGSSGNSSNIAIPQDQWVLFVVEMIAGRGRFAVNDAQPRAMFGTLTAAVLNAISIGAAWAGIQGIQFDALRLTYLDQTGFADDDWSKVRTYAAGQLNLPFSNESRFEDTFTRADTADNQLGIGETGHKWEGSSTAARILNNTLTIVSPWTTNYSWTQINFAPSQFGWDYTTRNMGGTVREVGAVLITKARQNLTNMLHLTWSRDGWNLEQYLSSGSVITHVVASRLYSGDILAGSISVRVDWNAGLIWITGADGVEVECDWNGSTATEPLANYRTPYLCYEVGVQSAGTPDDVIQYARTWANK